VDNPLASHEKMVPKRFRKLETLRGELEAPPRYGSPDPRIGVIGWGSTEGAIREAVERCVAKGIKVAALHPKVLSPLPERHIEEFLRSVETVIVPEVNYTGQFARYLRSIFGIPVVRLNKWGGLPFTAREIERKIEEVADGR
jgi:2-oxoglutarate ferredoxin oxidoreductase subunit alpha